MSGKQVEIDAQLASKLSREQQPLKEVSVDHEGNFTVEGLPQGEYNVVLEYIDPNTFEAKYFVYDSVFKNQDPEPASNLSAIEPVEVKVDKTTSINFGASTVDEIKNRTVKFNYVDVNGRKISFDKSKADIFNIVADGDIPFKGAQFKFYLENKNASSSNTARILVKPELLRSIGIDPDEGLEYLEKLEASCDIGKERAIFERGKFKMNIQKDEEKKEEFISVQVEGKELFPITSTETVPESLYRLINYTMDGVFDSETSSLSFILYKGPDFRLEIKEKYKKDILKKYSNIFVEADERVARKSFSINLDTTEEREFNIVLQEVGTPSLMEKVQAVFKPQSVYKVKPGLKIPLVVAIKNLRTEKSSKQYLQSNWGDQSVVFEYKGDELQTFVFGSDAENGNYEIYIDAEYYMKIFAINLLERERRTHEAGILRARYPIAIMFRNLNIEDGAFLINRKEIISPIMRYSGNAYGVVSEKKTEEKTGAEMSVNLNYGILPFIQFGFQFKITDGFIAGFDNENFYAIFKEKYRLGIFSKLTDDGKYDGLVPIIHYINGEKISLNTYFRPGSERRKHSSAKLKILQNYFLDAEEQEYYLALLPVENLKTLDEISDLRRAELKEFEEKIGIDTDGGKFIFAKMVIKKFDWDKREINVLFGWGEYNIDKPLTISGNGNIGEIIGYGE